METTRAKKAIGKLVTDSVAPPVITTISPALPLRATITSKPYSLDARMGKEAINSITPADGLPPGRYYSRIVQDQSGNLWFTNVTNIIKYDGHSFTSYPLVPGDNVMCDEIAITKNNELWAVMFHPDSAGTGNVYSLYSFNGLYYDQCTM